MGTVLIFVFAKNRTVPIYFSLLAFLAAALSSLGETLLAIDRTISAGLERYFTLLLAVCADCLIHLPWLPRAAVVTASSVTHTYSSLLFD